MPNEALVLRKTDYEETSLIINVLTSTGYESLMVKGAKRKNSEKLGICEPITLISYEKGRSKTFPLLLEGVILDSYLDLKDDLLHLSIASIVTDYVLVIKESLIDFTKLYRLVLDTLEDMRDNPDPELSLFRFEVLLSTLLGIGIHKNYLQSEYEDASLFLPSLNDLFEGKEIESRPALRQFFSEYYSHEMNIVLKSKKLYWSLVN